MPNTRKPNCRGQLTPHASSYRRHSTTGYDCPRHRLPVSRRPRQSRGRGWGLLQRGACAEAHRCGYPIVGLLTLRPRPPIAGRQGQSPSINLAGILRLRSDLPRRQFHTWIVLPFPAAARRSPWMQMDHAWIGIAARGVRASTPPSARPKGGSPRRSRRLPETGHPRRKPAQ